MNIEKIAYAEDFYGWLNTTAKLLRNRELSSVDFENIAEELESMGKSEKRELASRLTILLVHLLKWQYQPEKRSRSWENTIKIQRIDIEELLEESPSLHYEIERVIDTAYRKARIRAEDETGLDQHLFPTTCPYSFEQLRNDEYYPA